MPDTSPEKRLLSAKLRRYTDGSLERKMSAARQAVKAKFGETADVVSTFGDRVFVLLENKDIVQVPVEWDGDSIGLGEVSEPVDTLFASRKEISAFVADRMQSASKLLIVGDITAANDALIECSDLLVEGAGSWMVQDVFQELAERFTAARAWRSVATFADRPRLLAESFGSGIDLSLILPTSLQEGGDRKKLIQESLLLMIHKSERFLDLAGEHLVSMGESAAPEVVQVIRGIASDVAFLSDRLEESVECIPHTEESDLLEFHSFVSGRLTDMAFAFVASVARSVDEQQSD